VHQVGDQPRLAYYACEPHLDSKPYFFRISFIHIRDEEFYVTLNRSLELFNLLAPEFYI
jgi:hypothetical protein